MVSCLTLRFNPCHYFTYSLIEKLTCIFSQLITITSSGVSNIRCMIYCTWCSLNNSKKSPKITAIDKWLRLSNCCGDITTLRLCYALLALLCNLKSQLWHRFCPHSEQSTCAFCWLSQSSHMKYIFSRCSHCSIS